MSRRPGTKSALLVIDVQNGVVEGAFERAARIGKINEAVGSARAHETPVVWIQHCEADMPVGSVDWEIVEELSPAEGEFVVPKEFRSSFEDTNLEEILDRAEVGHVFICGAQTNNCVRHTSHAALERGYDVTILEDAHTTTDADWDNGPVLAQHVIDEFNQSFHHYDVPGRQARISSVADAAL